MVKKHDIVILWKYQTGMQNFDFWRDALLDLNNSIRPQKKNCYEKYKNIFEII